MQSYVSRVRFVEACTAIPGDALLLEIGPHALLRSPLRQNRATLPCASARTPTPFHCHAEQISTRNRSLNAESLTAQYMLCRCFAMVAVQGQQPSCVLKEALNMT